MDSQVEAVRCKMLKVEDEKVEIKQDLATAKQEKNGEKEGKLFDMLLSLNNRLSGLQEEKNLLLRSQAPSVPVPTVMPTINIQITPEMLANIQLPTHADDQRSYAPSKTNYEQAKEAANRMGWTLHSPKMYNVPSSRQVPTFEWPDKEDDSRSKLLVQQALEAQMHLPDNVSIFTVERQVLVCFETERQNKRTKLTAKTDYVMVYHCNLVNYPLPPILHLIVMMFGTKSPSAFKNSLSRGGAAIESLAVNAQLKEDLLRADDDIGVPVVLTDMNTFHTFEVPRIGDQSVQELLYPSTASAYEHLTKLAKSLHQQISLRSVASTADSPPAAAPLAFPASSPLPLTTATAEANTQLPGSGRRDAALPDVKDAPKHASGGVGDHLVHNREDGLDWGLGVQNIMHSCSIPVCSEVPEFEVYIEELNHAVARALTPRLVREPDITEMHAIPPELAGLYMDPQLRRL